MLDWQSCQICYPLEIKLLLLLLFVVLLLVGPDFTVSRVSVLPLVGRSSVVFDCGIPWRIFQCFLACIPSYAAGLRCDIP